MGLRFLLLAWNGMGDGQVKLNFLGLHLKVKKERKEVGSSG